MKPIELGIIAAWHNGFSIGRNLSLNLTINEGMALIANEQLKCANENTHLNKILLKYPDKVYIGSSQNDDDPFSFSDKNRCNITDLYKKFCETRRKKYV